MTVKQLVILGLQLSIVCTVFGFGLRATPRNLVYLFRHPSLLFRSLLSVFIVMPIVAVAMATVFDFRRGAEIALIALSISPVPPLLPNKEMKAGGQESFGLALMATLALLSIVAVPLAAKILERVFNLPLNADAGAIARVALVMAVFPLLAGVAVRAYAPAAADRIERPVSLVARVLLPLAVLALLAGTWRAVAGAVGGGAVAAMVAFVAIGLAVGDVLGGPNPEDSIVLALSTACRHPAIALSVAAATYPEEQFAGPILLYLIVNTIVGMAYLKWRHSAGVPVAA
jgi:BASS family bile acid:Na+ symporter